MSDIKNNDLLETIQHIMGSMDAIQDFARNIQSISSKTNMLSLNASIEAARSGEMGRGFAVVADQMRSLANETKDSSVQIQQMLEKLKEEMAEMKTAVENQADAEE